MTSPVSSPYLSYSASVKKVTRRSHIRQTRNVLIVTLEKRIEGSQVNLIETICKEVGLAAVLDTQGYQVFMPWYTCFSPNKYCPMRDLAL